MLSKLMFFIPYRTLKRNKARTCLTMIGIFLSVVLLTSIIILATSYKSSLIATTIEKKGDWHYFRQTDYKTATFNIDNEPGECEKVTLINEVGYSPIPGFANAQKPYAHISTIKTNDTKMLPLKLIKGNLPVKDGEIIISKSYADTYEKKIGESIVFDIGKRISFSGDDLHQNSSYLGESKEGISTEFVLEYKVVGITETIGFLENSFSPGYSFLAFGESYDYTNAYVKLKNPNDCKKAFNEYGNIVFNKDLLDVLGVTPGENIGDTITAMIVALGAFIAINCFIIINNTFMLSINEKAKDYALYNSLGMTNGQILATIIGEGAILSLIIVPLAILFSVGIVTLFASAFTQMLSIIAYSGIVLKMDYNMFLLIGVGLFCMAMVIISSIIPFILNKNKLGISGIKGNHIIKNKTKRVSNASARHKSVFMQIILNNFKRYKGKYVFSFISIIMSMTLLLNVSSFCEYSTAQIYNENFEQYDIYCDSNNMKISTSIQDIYKPFSDMKETQKSWWVSSDFIGRYKIITSELSEEANVILSKEKAEFLDVQYLILDDKTYNDVYNEIAKMRDVDENYIPAIACLPKDISAPGKTVKTFAKDRLTISFSESENFICNTLNMKLLQSNYPKILESYYLQGGINIFLSMDHMAKYLKEEPNNIRFYFDSNNSSLLYDEMLELQNDKGWDISITNYFASLEKEVSYIKIFEALANIFLLIVGSIVLLNIINTISQTIMMRKREFAIFSSIGMQDKTLLRLTLSENFAMYIIALVFGVCITLALSALFKIAFKATFYFFPWLLFLIINAIFALVIFCVSLLFFKKATDMNTIETIKNETV